jgi:hypothetical protein
MEFEYWDVPFLRHFPEADDDFFVYGVKQNLLDARERVKSSLKTALQSQENLDQYFAKIQAWLRFGLIQDTFRTPIYPEDLVSGLSSSDHRILDSQRLSAHMKAWVRASRAKGPLSIRGGTLADTIRLRRSLQIGWQFCNRLDDTDAAYTAAQIMVCSQCEC